MLLMQNTLCGKFSLGNNINRDTFGENIKEAVLFSRKILADIGTSWLHQAVKAEKRDVCLSDMFILAHVRVGDEAIFSQRLKNFNLIAFFLAVICLVLLCIHQVIKLDYLNVWHKNEKIVLEHEEGRERKNENSWIMLWHGY